LCITHNLGDENERRLSSCEVAREPAHVALIFGAYDSTHR
jgi:hypothetical protein